MKNCNYRYSVASSWIKVGLMTAGLGLFNSTAWSQDIEAVRLNTVLDIDALYAPLESENIYGQTAISLLEELQTKH